MKQLKKKKAQQNTIFFTVLLLFCTLYWSPEDYIKKQTRSKGKKYKIILNSRFLSVTCANIFRKTILLLLTIMSIIL